MILKNNSRFAAATVLFVGYCHRRDIFRSGEKEGCLLYIDNSGCKLLNDN